MNEKKATIPMNMTAATYVRRRRKVERLVAVKNDSEATLKAT